MATSINASQIQANAQSLAAYLQALQAKQDGTTIANGNASGTDTTTAGTAVAGTSSSSKNANGKDPTEQVTGQPLDVVTLSAEAQRLLVNAQAPSVGPGSLATYLNTSNTSNNGIGQVASSDQVGSGYEGAIAQFRQWLSRPLGQPVPYSGDQSYNDPNQNKPTTTSTDQTAASGTQPASSTSS